MKMSSLSSTYQNKYNNVVFLTTHNTKTNKWKNRAILANQLSEELERLHVFGSLDYYISANSFEKKKNLKRLAENVIALNHIVMDIDIHNTEDEVDSFEQVEQLLFAIKKDLIFTKMIPPPNRFIKTGRGIQLWYDLVPTSVKLDFLYLQVVVRIGKQIESLKNDYRIDFNVDLGASKKINGVFRLPDTINSKCGVKVSSEHFCDDLYDLNDLIKIIPNEINYDRESQMILSKTESARLYKIDTYTTLQGKRLDFIKYLLKRRKYKENEEPRDLIFFVYFNEAFKAYDEESARKDAMALNSLFQPPMEEKRCMGIMTYIISKGGLKMHNHTFLEWLQCDEHERRLYNESNGHFRRKIEHLLENLEFSEKVESKQNKGLSPNDIAKELGVDVRKVRNLIGSTAKIEKQSRNKKILEMYKDGISIKGIVKETGISRNTIKRIIREDCNA
jgi:DNA-directed RNA polymerase specialized sigma24 family protein